MSFSRAASYTWRAFLTFLVIGIPGIVVQSITSYLLTTWRYGGGEDRIDTSKMGIASSLEGLSGLWIQFAVIFVIFKYAPSAIVEVQENRQAARMASASEASPNLEQ